MAHVVRTQVRQRGIFGMLAWWAFLLFNALMVFMVWAAISGTSTQFQATTDGAARAGTAIGGGLAVGMIMALWFFGDLILGLIVMLSRGKTVTIERTVD